MRQFVLGGNVAGLTDGTVQSMTDADAGKVGVGYYPSGVATFDTGANIKDKAFVALIRTAAQGGNVFLPLYKKDFSYVKSEYIAATTFKATVVIPAPSASDTDYTIIAVLKGVKFNERNKWTANVHLSSNDTPTTIGDKIVKYFMDGTVARYGLKVTNAAGTLTFEAVEAGVNWELVPADDLYGTTVTYVAKGAPAQNDAAMVADLAAKAAADAGFEYTYKDPSQYLYANYPLNPLKAADSADNGFTVFTLRFAEPREVKTVDEVVHQIIQVAFPTGADGITTFEKACKYLAGETVETEEPGEGE